MSDNFEIDVILQEEPVRIEREAKLRDLEEKERLEAARKLAEETEERLERERRNSVSTNYVDGVAAGLTFVGNQPAHPNKGDVFYDTSTGQIKIFDGKNWLILSAIQP